MRATVVPAIVALPLVLGACVSDRDSSSASRVTGPRLIPPAGSSDVLPLTVLTCGALINSDVRLDNDLTCSGNALVVSGEDITIDLNGHTLTGTAVGAGNGIMVMPASDGVTIFGGTITGFLSGIFVGGSTDILIRNNAFTLNREAVLFQATAGSTIKHNVATNNLSRAFMVRPNLAGVLSTNNIIIGNEVSGTPTGIFLIRQPGNVIQENTIAGAGIAAIDLGEGTGTVSDNIIRANLLTGGGAGIRFTSGWTGNTFVGNRIAANLCGTQGPTTGNTFNGNVFRANSSDACP